VAWEVFGQKSFSLCWLVPVLVIRPKVDARIEHELHLGMVKRMPQILELGADAECSEYGHSDALL